MGHFLMLFFSFYHNVYIILTSEILFFLLFILNILTLNRFTKLMEASEWTTLFGPNNKPRKNDLPV